VGATGGQKRIVPRRMASTHLMRHIVGA
jgi:hypothetical protein